MFKNIKIDFWEFLLIIIIFLLILLNVFTIKSKAIEPVPELKNSSFLGDIFGQYPNYIIYKVVDSGNYRILATKGDLIANDINSGNYGNIWGNTSTYKEWETTDLGTSWTEIPDGYGGEVTVGHPNVQIKFATKDLFSGGKVFFQSPQSIQVALWNMLWHLVGRAMGVVTIALSVVSLIILLKQLRMVLMRF